MSSYRRLSFPTGAALIAGGSGGLGSAIARDLASAGMPVVIGYRTDVARAEALAGELNGSGGKALAVQFDTSSGPSITAAVA